jgi:hypothetical protein
MVRRKLGENMRTTSKLVTLAVLFLFAGVAEAQWVMGVGGRIYYNGGPVGIGTTDPSADLHIKHAAADATASFETAGTANYSYGRFLIPANSTVNDTQAGFFFQEGAGNYTAGNRFYSFGFNPIADGFVILGGSAPTQRLVIKANGFVGIGTTAPAALLDVNGSVNVAGNIAAKYQDVAEWVVANQPLEPGVVVVLNPDKTNEVMPSFHSYDSTVAGVVSSKPGLILGEAALNKEQIATSGRVKVRVDATKNPIHIGDLLVTGEKAGAAMKSVALDFGGVKMHRPGTIIGKALEPLEKGEGEILVLLTLQ